VVTGTVRTVDTDAIEVTDSTGAIVRVFVPKTATVTTPGLGGLAFGDPVSVTGTTAVDGSVTATAVTARRTSGRPSASGPRVRRRAHRDASTPDR
jgi:hypothetical protein